MVRIGDFLKSLFNPESENYKLGLISCSSLILLFSLLFSKFHKFFIIILVLYFIFLPVILYRNRMYIMEKEAAVFIFILLFQLTIITGHPLFLIFLVVSILTFCNIFAQKKERIIQTQAIIMIALTLIILEVSYPIFEPRVEVEYVGEMYKGYIFNEITYGYQDFTLSIVPPLLPFSLLRNSHKLRFLSNIESFFIK